MRWITRVVTLTVVLLVGHRVWQQQRAVQAAMADLDAQRRGIVQTEGEIDQLDRAIDASEARLEALDAKITSMEHDHPGGIPESLRPEYLRLVADQNEAVAQHNALVARHTALRGEYKARVDRHNARVDQANASENGIVCSVLPGWISPRACGTHE